MARIITRPFGGHKSRTAGCRMARAKPRSPRCSANRLSRLFFVCVFLKAIHQHILKVPSSLPLESCLRRHFHVPVRPVSDFKAANSAPDCEKRESSETWCHRCSHSHAAITQLSVHKIASADVYKAEKHVCSFVIKSYSDSQSRKQQPSRWQRHSSAGKQLEVYLQHSAAQV